MNRDWAYLAAAVSVGVIAASFVVAAVWALATGMQ